MEFVWRIVVLGSVCTSGYPEPDFSVNFMAAENPVILKGKSGCYGYLQKNIGFGSQRLDYNALGFIVNVHLNVVQYVHTELI